jgi:hypothetical protein
MSGLADDLTERYLEWLRAEGHVLDQPSAFDFPELDDEEVEDAIEEAKLRYQTEMNA